LVVRRQIKNALEEVSLQLDELDEERGSAPLPVRARALRAASVARRRAA
jgi:hypothetical protein